MSSTLNNDMLPRTSFQIFHGSLFCWIWFSSILFLVWPPGRHLDWRFLLIGHVSLCRLAFRLPTVFVLWNERERPGSERLTWLKRTGSWPWEKSKRQRIGRSRGFVWFICRWNWIFLSFFFICFFFKKKYIHGTCVNVRFLLRFVSHVHFDLFHSSHRKRGKRRMHLCTKLVVVRSEVFFPMRVHFCICVVYIRDY